MRYTAKDFSAISKKDRTALRCDLCGAPVSFYSKEYPAFNLSGKHICEACYKKEMETATFTCKDCRKIFLKRIGNKYQIIN